MGLVGLLVMDPMTGPPRVAGMKGQVVGYVVSHPGLQAKPWVRRNGQTLPVLAFKLTVVIGQADASRDSKNFGAAGSSMSSTIPRDSATLC